MGITPLAIADYFCQTPEKRREIEFQIREFSALHYVFIPGKDSLEKFLSGESQISEAQESPKLGGNFLSVAQESCHGALYVFSMTVASPTTEDFAVAEQFSRKLLDAGLCTSVMLNRGCESRGIFSKKYSPAMIGPPDFAKLAVLKRFGYLNVFSLREVVETMNAGAKHEKYCLDKWKSLVNECHADVRFFSALTKTGKKG